MVLSDNEVLPLVDDRSSSTTGCQLDVGRLTGVAKRFTAAIAGHPDLVIINRFGRAEAAGGGLTELISSALNSEIPVLIAVPEQRFPALIRFSGGMNVRLACRREALDRWWKSVTGASANGAPGGACTFCEIGK
jgi:nucleoside-triphosphatase THEP1